MRRCNLMSSAFDPSDSTRKSKIAFIRVGLASRARQRFFINILQAAWDRPSRTDHRSLCQSTVGVAVDQACLEASNGSTGFHQINGALEQTRPDSLIPSRNSICEFRFSGIVAHKLCAPLKQPINQSPDQNQ